MLLARRWRAASPAPVVSRPIPGDLQAETSLMLREVDAEAAWSMPRIEAQAEDLRAEAIRQAGIDAAASSRKPEPEVASRSRAER